MLNLVLWCITVLGLLDHGSAQSLSLTSIGAKKYYVNDLFRLNWFEADHFCRRNGMQMLTINSQYEYNSIVNYIRSNPNINGSAHINSIWTSYTEYGQPGTWVSMSTGLVASYLNWAPGQPDNYLGNQHIISLYGPSNYLMNDAEYSSEFYFLCEETPAKVCPARRQCGNYCCGC